MLLVRLQWKFEILYEPQTEPVCSYSRVLKKEKRKRGNQIYPFVLRS